MKKFLAFIFIFALAITPVLAAPTDNAHDDLLRSGNAVNTSMALENGETVTYKNGSAVVFGQNIEITENHDGSMVIAGQDITVSSVINGDLLVFGQYVEILQNANIKGNLYVFAQRVNVRGTVDKDIAAFAQNLNIEPATVRDVNVFGQSASVSGSIRSINAWTANAVVAGNISGDVWGNEDLIVASGANIAGTVNVFEKKAKVISVEENNRNPIFNFVKFVQLGSFLIIWLLLTFLFKGTKRKLDENNKTKFWWQLLGGLLFAVLSPIVILITCLTVIGLPLGIVEIMLMASAWILAGAFGVIAVADKLGSVMPKLAIHKGFWLALVLELAVILLSFVPVIGSLLGIFLNLLGLGAIVNIFWKKKVVIVDEN